MTVFINTVMNNIKVVIVEQHYYFWVRIFLAYWQVYLISFFFFFTDCLISFSFFHTLKSGCVWNQKMFIQASGLVCAHACVRFALYNCNKNNWCARETIYMTCF